MEKLTSKEAEVCRLTALGHGVDEIALRLIMDPVQVRRILNFLVDRHYLDESLRPVKISNIVTEKPTAETQRLKELSADEVFERLLESKLRPEIKEKIGRGAEEREMLVTFLSQLSKKPSAVKPEIVEKERLKEETVETRPKVLTRFPMKVFGDAFHAGDGVTAVIGDAEIPAGSIVDKPLVVKGKLNVGANCLILKNLKALGGITIADGCSVKANLYSGDIVELGKNTVIEGDVYSESSINLSKGVEIYGLVDAGGAAFALGNITSEASS